MLAPAAIDRVRQIHQPIKIIKPTDVGHIVRLKNAPAFIFLKSGVRNAKMFRGYARGQDPLRWFDCLRHRNHCNRVNFTISFRRRREKRGNC
jgi:hypothetical protein